MATYDRLSGTTSSHSAVESRLDPRLRLDWSALFGGWVLGWGVLLVLSLIAAVVGLAVIDPFAARPAVSNAGAAAWGAVSATIASFVGSFAMIRLAGDRRRDESMMHGAVAWGMSMLLAAFIALFASGAAARSRTPAGNTSLHSSARGRTAALVETTGNGAVVAGYATAGALLALVGSLLGALAAASRSSGLPFPDELRRGTNSKGTDREPATADLDLSRDETTILPPSH